MTAPPAPPELPHTYAWAASTGGALDAEQRRLVAAAIRAGYAEIARGAAGWAFTRSRACGVRPSAPDSRLARSAEEAAREQGPALLGHAYRTWVLGHALAEHDGVRLDAELFYACSLLHDSGMTREVVGQDFTVRSGEDLIGAAAAAGCEEAVGIRLADAAVGHATPGMTAEIDPIATYVQDGAMADLTGARLWHLPRGYARAAYRAHPAAGIHRAIRGHIRQDARAVPQGRFAMLARAGFGPLVAVAPTRWVARG